MRERERVCVVVVVVVYVFDNIYILTYLLLLLLVLSRVGSSLLSTYSLKLFCPMFLFSFLFIPIFPFLNKPSPFYSLFPFSSSTLSLSLLSLSLSLSLHKYMYIFSATFKLDILPIILIVPFTIIQQQKCMYYNNFTATNLLNDYKYFNLKLV